MSQLVQNLLVDLASAPLDIINGPLNDLLMESRKLALKQKGRPGRSMLGHEAVVAALRQRDADGAAEAMREHIDQIADLLHRPS